jgi:hypothetical protein
MNLKSLTVLAVCVAVIAAAVAVIHNGMASENAARENAAAARAEESKAAAEAKKAKAEADKAKAEASQAEAVAKSQAEQKAAAEIENATAKLRLKSDEESRKANEARLKTAEIERETASLNAKAKADAAKAAAAEKEKAKALENAEALKAEAAANNLAAEKLRSEKIVAEAKTLELAKIDFETWQRDLVELQQSLEERERALKPDKTIADLSWVGGGEDMVADDKGNLKRIKKEPYLAEKDLSLPKGERMLAKANRLAGESYAEEAARIRQAYISEIEKLWLKARDEDRVVDAQFYFKAIKSLDPAWEYKVKEDKKQ